jgi:hypothetical protein
MEDRYSLPPEIAAALERARLQVEALAQTADELQIVLPDAVGSALRDGLREEAAPISRRLAEVKGLTNQMIRRLERLETDLLIERHARIDDLALLVDLITAQWRSMNERLDRIERAIALAGRRALTNSPAGRARSATRARTRTRARSGRRARGTARGRS